MSAPSGSSPALDPALEDLSSLESAESRRAYLDRHQALIQAESVEAMADAVRRLLRIDVGAAIRAGDAAVSIAERLDDPAAMARALRAKGNGHWFEGKCSIAVELMEKAIALFERAGLSDEVGRTLSTSIQPYILLGDYQAALRNAGRAREIFTGANDELRLARLDLNVANIFHRQEQFAEALAAYERAYRQLLRLGDAEGIGVALHNLAVCLIIVDDFDRALETYSQAREFLNQHGMPKLVFQADYNIAYLYFLRGDYERAIDMLLSTRSHCAEDDPYHAALCNLDLSDIYLELNLFEEADEIASRAVEGFERLRMGYELARSLTNLAIAATNRGRTRRATLFFERARERFASEGHKNGEALVNLYQAMLLSNTGAAQDARMLCSRAKDVFRDADLGRKAVLCDLLFSRLALSESDLAASEQHCNAAEGRLASLHAPVLNYQARLQRGRILEAKGDSAGGGQAYCEAAAELETLSCAMQGEELKIAFVANKLEVYERLTALALKDGLTGAAAEQAFSFIERAKSRNLAESLFGRATPLPKLTAANDASSAKIRRLREELNWCYHRIQAEEVRENGTAASRLARLWAEARARENDILEQLREKRGSDGEQPGGESTFVAVSDLRAAIDPGMVLVEYFQIGDQLLAGVLTRSALDMVPLGSAAGVRKRLRMLQLQLSRALLRPDAARSPAPVPGTPILTHLRVLYEDLIRPLEPYLRGSHLIVAPHGCLHYLPLHALHDGTNYLIDRFTFSYVPSASVYSVCLRARSQSGRRSLVLGVEDSRTPWISQEVRAVASVVPEPQVLLGANARIAALEQWGQESRFVHIASHGSFRSDNPLFSAVRLADSYLSVYDLYNIRLPVELLTLSGCATGLNVVAAGDELLGLVRVLLYAGARTLLLTLWDIQDRSTAEFMRLFYTRLQQGEGKAAALRTAMQELREDFPHPGCWAPFVLVGRIT